MRNRLKKTRATWDISKKNYLQMYKRNRYRILILLAMQLKYFFCLSHKTLGYLFISLDSTSLQRCHHCGTLKVTKLHSVIPTNESSAKLATWHKTENSNKTTVWPKMCRWRLYICWFYLYVIHSKVPLLNRLWDSKVNGWLLTSTKFN